MTDEIKKIDSILDQLANQSRINELIISVQNYNNSSEYLRIKYYKNMISDMRLLNQYMKGAI
jgi:hypothetical protein